MILPGSGPPSPGAWVQKLQTHASIVLPFQERKCWFAKVSLKAGQGERSIRSRAWRGIGDGPEPAFAFLGSAQGAQEASRLWLTCEYARLGAGPGSERLANEEETLRGQLNSPWEGKGTEGKVRSSRARVIVGGNPNLPGSQRTWSRDRKTPA